MDDRGQQNEDEEGLDALAVLAGGFARRSPNEQMAVAPQKWVQCASCNKWRKVPYDLNDEDIADDWACENNIWDKDRRSCSVPQALSDEQIDEILALQEGGELDHGRAQTSDGDDGDADDEGVGNNRSYRGAARPSAVGARGAHSISRAGSSAKGIASASPRSRAKPPTISRAGSGVSKQSAAGQLKASSKRKEDVGRAGQIKMAAKKGGAVGQAAVVKESGRDSKAGAKNVKKGGSKVAGHKAAGGAGGGAKAKGKASAAGMNEAVEALLGIGGSAFSSGGADQDEGNADADEVQQRWPRSTMRPGKVVWAKVEGHDWWPAQVVRRRGVPREVGPPPTTDAASMGSWLPVVFFTPTGIPRDGQPDQDGEEAEYAWLTPDLLKPFDGEDGGDTAADPDLQACVEAAEAAVEEGQAREQEDNDDDDMDGESDSDGGWGAAIDDLNRRHVIASRRSHPRREDDGGVADEADSIAPLNPDGTRCTVEAILGLRHAGGSEGVKSEDEDADLKGVSQDEQGAVAALLAAAAGDPTLGPTSPVKRGPEVRVKWSGRAHIFDEWLPESQVAAIAKRKLFLFKKRYGAKACDHGLSEWEVPERFVARRPAPHAPGWQVLVKWSLLGYDAATWEPETEGIVASREYVPLMEALLERQAQASERSSPYAMEAEMEARPNPENVPTLDEQPAWVTPGRLRPHQVDAINWLRKHWAAARCGVLADDPGLGRTSTVATFLRDLEEMYKITRPSLVVVPATSIEFWESEMEFWAGDTSNVVTYTGTAAARHVIAEQELWLWPSSMDGKDLSAQQIRHKVPKPRIVLTTFEAVTSDAEVLGQLAWECIVLDDRHATRWSHGRMYQALGKLAARFRLLLTCGLPGGSPTDMFNALHHLQPSTFQSMKDVADGFEGWEEQQQAAVLKQLLASNSLCRKCSSIFPARFSNTPYITGLRARATKAQHAVQQEMLVRSFPILSDAEGARTSGQRCGQLRTLYEDLVEVFSYPELADLEGDAVACLSHVDTKSSGKLVLLDRLLQQLHTEGRQVLLISHRPRILRMLEAYASERFGSQTVAVIHHEVSTAERHATLAALRRSASGPWLVLHEGRCLGLGTDLPRVNSVVVFDSEFSPIGDLTALSRPMCIGDNKSPLPVFRLLASPVEERMAHLQAGDGQAAEGILRPAQGKSIALASELLEDVVRTGAARVFTDESVPECPELSDEDLASVIEAAIQGDCNAVPKDIVAVWHLALDKAEEAENAVGGWDEHHMPALEVQLPFDGEPSIPCFPQSVRETATFWTTLLGNSWERLQASEAAGAHPADGDPDAMDEDMLDSPAHADHPQDKDAPSKDGSGHIKGGKGNTKGRRREEDVDADGDGAGSQHKKRKRKGSKADSDIDAISREREDLIRELVRQETVRNAISEPGSVEARILSRAGGRLGEICNEAGLEDSEASQLLTMAKEAAEVLLVLHHDGQTLSEFQDYTLVAIAAVAAHLCRINLPGSETRGIAVLAARYGHAELALEQVYDHVLECLRHYRAFHDRRHQFALEDPSSMEAAVLAETERQRKEVPSEDPAATSLDAIGSGRSVGDAQPSPVTDPVAAAAAAASAVGVPGLAGDALVESSAEFLGKLNGIVQEHWQICAAVLQSTATLDAVAKNPPSMEVMSTWQWNKIGEQIQEHVDYLNQSHEAKVKRIDEEYHRFMEKVRERALGAIDKAKGHYSTAFHYMANRREQYCNLYNSFQEATHKAAAQAAAAAAAAAALHQGGAHPHPQMPVMPQGSEQAPPGSGGPPSSQPQPPGTLSAPTSGRPPVMAIPGLGPTSSEASGAPETAPIPMMPSMVVGAEGIAGLQAGSLQAAQMQMLLMQQTMASQQQALMQHQAHEQQQRRQEIQAAAAAATAAAAAAAASDKGPDGVASNAKREVTTATDGNARDIKQPQTSGSKPGVPQQLAQRSSPAVETSTSTAAGAGAKAGPAGPAKLPSSFQRLSHQQVQQVLQTLKHGPARPGPRNPRPAARTPAAAQPSKGVSKPEGVNGGNAADLAAIAAAAAAAASAGGMPHAAFPAMMNMPPNMAAANVMMRASDPAVAAAQAAAVQGQALAPPVMAHATPTGPRPVKDSSKDSKKQTSRTPAAVAGPPPPLPQSKAQAPEKPRAPKATEPPDGPLGAVPAKGGTSAGAPTPTPPPQPTASAPKAAAGKAAPSVDMKPKGPGVLLEVKTALEPPTSLLPGRGGATTSGQEPSSSFDPAASHPAKVLSLKLSPEKAHPPPAHAKAKIESDVMARAQSLNEWLGPDGAASPVLGLLQAQPKGRPSFAASSLAPSTSHPPEGAPATAQAPPGAGASSKPEEAKALATGNGATGRQQGN